MATKVKPSRLQVSGQPQAGKVPVYVDENTFQRGDGGGDIKVFEIQGPLDYATAEESRLEYLRGSPVIVMYGGNAYQYTTDTMLYSDIPSVFSTTTISVHMLNYTMSGGSVTGITSDIMTFTKPGVIDNLTSSSTTDALSANQGKILKTLVDNLTSRGRFLSLWNSATGLAVSTPQSLPYTYQTGDYFIVGVTGTTNYRPDGSSYTGTASTVVETGEVEVGDTYAYDGTNWLLQNNHGKTVTFSEIAGDPYDNTNLASALNDKQDVSNMVTTLSGADNNHYPTAKAVADAISSAGGGDVLGPASSTNGDVVLFDGTTGKLIKDSGVQLSSKADDADVVHKSGDETITGVKTFGTTNTWKFDGVNAELYSPVSNGYLYVTRGGSTPVTMAIKSGTSGGTFGTTTAHQFQFRTNDVARMTVQSTGQGGKVELANASIPATGDNSNLVPSTSWVNTAITNGIAGKQDTISDLSTIRSGASAGATALQPGDDVSELNNDAGYATQTYVDGELALKQDELVSGVNIRTINGTSILGSGDIDTSQNTQWGDIVGTLSDQTDLQNALNAKQATLVSGTNIKTVNNTSLLGSGNIAVQPTLVSGTNIKTINGNTVLGSGDLAISGLPSQSGQAGKYLTTDGTNASWATVSGGIENDTTGTTTTVGKIWAGSESEYNGLSSYDASTIYYVF